MVLTACGKKGAGSASGALTDDLGEMEKTLSVFNWSDYIAPDTIANFEQEFGVKVRYDTYESNEEMILKLQSSGGERYDVIVPSNYVIPVVVAADLASPLVKRYLPNFRKPRPDVRQSGV